MAHTMRAILLAKATAASLRGLRLSKLSSHCEVAGRLGLACWMTAVAPSTSNCRSRSSPARLMPPRRCRPAVERSRGTSPSQAAKCRAEANFPASTRSAKFSAPIGPIPGIAASRRVSGLLVLLHQPSVDRPQPQLDALGLPAQERYRLLGRGRHRYLIGRGDLGLQPFETLL